ncbi:hypothetical protein ANCDUO_23857 [Ancylostoma duodenale]|uniref:Uncharacterized protein n=1 Tax=Ancylostoma duodenale TaxID=51022 RepID=A0A0C2FMJ3_9BILA|nr:hypothetical protein ANCDUO_23857 [Ancylostoma duodenale]
MSPKKTIFSRKEYAANDLNGVKTSTFHGFHAGNVGGFLGDGCSAVNLARPKSFGFCYVVDLGAKDLLF